MNDFSRGYSIDKRVDSTEFYENANDQMHDEISIAWRNLRFESSPFYCLGTKKVILRRLNGHFRYHTLNALMGPSGAGKTTLLNCLTGNLKLGLNAESEIYLNHKEQSPVVYFVEQHVHRNIVARLTVGETLRFAYRFKNRGKKGQMPMEQYIRDTIKELMLDELVLNRHFGDCSGGEQKRIAIGQELMSLEKPTLLFVDEPTTGLDSNAAFLVMNCLRQLTFNYRMTVIASIHMPNNETLNLFDKLYVLAKGGVCVYSGPPKSLGHHLLAKLNLETAQEQHSIEALLKVACSGLDNSSVIHLANSTLCDEYNQIESCMSHLEYKPSGLPHSRSSFSLGHLFLQLWRVLKMLFICDIRLFAGQLITYVLFIGMLSTMFDHEMVRPSGCFSFEESNTTCTRNELKGNSLLMENINYISFSSLFLGIVQMITSSVIFSPLVRVFRNEHRNKWYSLGVFYWSSSIVSMLQLSLIAVLISALIYFMPEEHAIDDYRINWNRLSQFTFVIWVLSVYMQSIGQLVGAILVDQIEVAIILCQIIIAFIYMMNGLFFNVDQDDGSIFTRVSSVVALKYLTKYLLYTIYAIDRCDPERGFSIVLEEYHVDGQCLPEYILRVAINCVVLRVATFLYMYYRFNTFTLPSCKNLSSNGKSTLIPIDHLQGQSFSINIQQNTNGDKTERIKEEREIEFEQFAKHKLMIAWRNLTLFASSSIFEMDVTSLDSPKTILRNLNGQFRFGTMNALMGTSGAGKTTLLKTLNGQFKTRLSRDSRFYLSNFTKIVTCFITQEVSCHLLPGLTAKQALIYASRIKNQELENGRRKIDHEKIALYLLNELSIRDTCNTRVESCSGGERKRLALALELTSLQMPNLICIDEPTSGLDSNSAEIVMSCLARMARSHNLTIITSIHQPNTEVLILFDQLYVLARGGVCVYSGAPNHISTHLRTVPQITMTDCTFPIETLVKHSCSGHHDSIVQRLVQNNDQQWAVGNSNKEFDEQVHFVADGVQQNRSRFSATSSYVLCLRYLAYVRGHLWMQWLGYTVLYIAYSYVLKLFFDPQIAFPSGCIQLEDDFNNTCAQTAEKQEEDNLLKDNFKYNFFFFSIFLFLILLQCCINFSTEVVYFYNEHRNGWYSSGSYYLMKSLSETLPLVPIIMYHVWACNIYEVVRPGIYWYLVAVLILSAIGFQGMGQVFSLLTNGNVAILSIVIICVFLFASLLSNVFINLGRLHYIYRFLSNFESPRFIFEAGLILQYGFGRCHHKEVQVFLYMLNLKDEDFFHCILMLLFNIFQWRIIAIMLLVRKTNPVENRRQRCDRIGHYLHKLEPSKAIISGLSGDQQFRIKHYNLS